MRLASDDNLSVVANASGQPIPQRVLGGFLGSFEVVERDGILARGACVSVLGVGIMSSHDTRIMTSSGLTARC